MLFGAHEYLLTERWGDDRLAVLEVARAAGVEIFEIAVGDDVSFTPAATRRAAAALGMTLVVSPGALWPVAHDLSAPDADQRRAALAWHCRQLDLGAELGAIAYTGALYGHPGTVLPHPPTADEWAWMADGLHQLAAHGQRRGLAVVIEPMSHFRTHLINTPQQALTLLARADHANLAVLFDTYHALSEVRDYGAALRLLGRHLWGLHACENDRGVPGGGLIPWPAVFAALHELGFTGPVLLEAYNSAIPGFAHSRRMFHDVCPDGPAFIRQGLAFVRAGLAAAAAP